MWLCLQPNADVLDWAAENGIREAGKGAGEVVLCIAEGLGGCEGFQGGGGRVVAGLEEAAGEVKATELDRDLGLIIVSITTNAGSCEWE